MASTLLGGAISLIVALGFLSILLAKIPSTALWIVAAIGVAAMVVSLAEDLRSSENQAGRR